MPSASSEEAAAHQREKEDQVVHQEEKSPPAYSDSVQPPVIGELTAGFADLSIPPTNKIPNFPSKSLTIAHLKLLHAFYALKEDIGFTDGIFGIWDSQASAIDPKLDGDAKRSQALANIREKRWALYVARATERFAVYWTRAICKPENRRLTQGDMLRISFEQFPMFGQPVEWTVDMLPPLGEYFKYSIFPRAIRTSSVIENGLNSSKWRHASTVASDIQYCF